MKTSGLYCSAFKNYFKMDLFTSKNNIELVQQKLFYCMNILIKGYTVVYIFFPIIVIWSKISERRSISPSGNFLETCYGILNH